MRPQVWTQVTCHADSGDMSPAAMDAHLMYTYIYIYIYIYICVCVFVCVFEPLYTGTLVLAHGEA